MNLDNIMQKVEAQPKNDFPSDFYKWKEGSNKMRIMGDFTEVNTINRGGSYAGHVTAKNQPKGEDKVRMQGWAWAMMRGATTEADELRIIQCSKTILGQLVAFRNNPEYSFDTMPMPYDIDVQAKDAGTKEVVYTIVASRKNTDVTADEMAKLNKKRSVADIVTAIINKQEGTTSATVSQAKAEVDAFEAHRNDPNGADPDKQVF